MSVVSLENLNRSKTFSIITTTNFLGKKDHFDYPSLTQDHKMKPQFENGFISLCIDQTMPETNLKQI